MATRPFNPEENMAMFMARKDERAKILAALRELEGSYVGLGSANGVRDAIRVIEALP